MGSRFENYPMRELKTIELAQRYAPILKFDHREPFLPSRVGVTLFSRPGYSPSFPRLIEFHDKVEFVLEYAIWWDWDIQHLYELEHIWIGINEKGEVVNVEGSWHGKFHRFRTYKEKEGHPVIYSQPGKHAFSPDPRKFPLISTVLSCTLFAGNMGLLVKEMFAKELLALKTPEVDAVIRKYLRQYAFVPSFCFTREFIFSSEMFTSWEELRKYIPTRIKQIITNLLQKCEE